MPPKMKDERRAGGKREIKRSTVGRTTLAKACGVFLLLRN